MRLRGHRSRTSHEQRFERWRARFQQLHGKRNGEVITRRVWLMYARRRRAEEVIADRKDEGCGSIHLARFDEAAAACEHIEAGRPCRSCRRHLACGRSTAAGRPRSGSPCGPTRHRAAEGIRCFASLEALQEAPELTVLAVGTPFPR